MASVYRQTRSPYWWLKLRNHQGIIKRFSSGIHAEPPDSRDEAVALADELELSCRRLREWQHATWAQIMIAVELLEQHRLLTPEEAAEWRTHGPGPRLLEPITDPRRVTLRDAALAHPSVQREKELSDRSLQDHRRHLKELDEFTEWSGIECLRDLTADAVLDYVRKLKDDGRSWDGRRHRLLYLKAAATMAPRYGLINPLAGLRLDRREESDISQHGPQSLTKEQLGVILRHLRDRQNWRWLAAVGLMVSCALRPSEVLRVQVGDVYLKDRILQVGVRQRKTSASYRTLLMPPIVAGWVEKAAALAQKPTDPLIQTYQRGHRGNTVRLDNFGRHLIAQIETAFEEWEKKKQAAGVVKHAPKTETVTAAPTPTPKTFRKTFASVSSWDLGLDPQLIEFYMGRRVPGYSDVTQKHYVSRARIENLKPVAEAWERHLRSCIRQAKP